MKWVTVDQASDLIKRSPHTIYNWIARTQLGKVKLKIKRYSRKVQGGANGWLIEVNSLKKIDKGSPQRGLYAKKVSTIHNPDVIKASRIGKVRYDGGDSPEKVVDDRKKWVATWIEEGKSLERIIGVFNPHLHSEIESYYWQALNTQLFDVIL